MKAICLMMLACASIAIIPLTYAGGPDVPSQIHLIKHTLSARVFDRINASGYFNVVIKGVRPGSKPSVTIVTYHPSESLHTRVVNHTLYIKASWYPLPGLNKRPVVTVRINNLKRLTVSGPTNVKTASMRSQGLNIDALGSGTINLLGVLDVEHIRQRGSNHISVQWVKSKAVYINSKGFGSIRLAGTAKILFARMLGHSRLHAAYLRTHYVQVQTKDNATAYVCPVYTLRAFASNFGNIYYYKYPKNITRDAEQSGNVLQMAWHN